MPNARATIRSLLSGLSALGLLLAAAPAQADDPKFVYSKKEEVKAVEWKAAASVGFAYASGNANVLTLTGGATASRNDGKNKLGLDLSGIYGLTQLTVLQDTNGNGQADVLGGDPNAELGTQSKTTAGNFLGKLRYDRFLTDNNSLYVAGFGGLDVPASKRFLGGVQVGYARQIVKSKMHELLGEVGVDYNYTNYVAPDPAPVAFANHVHVAAARLFAGYVLTIRESTAINASLEALINLNPTRIGDRDIVVAEATRLIGKVGLTTKLWKALSFRASFGLRYDNAPGLNTQIKFAAPPDPLPNPNRYNQKLDTLTDVGLVVSFL